MLDLMHNWRQLPQFLSLSFTFRPRAAARLCTVFPGAYCSLLKDPLDYFSFSLISQLPRPWSKWNYSSLSTLTSKRFGCFWRAFELKMSFTCPTISLGMKKVSLVTTSFETTTYYLVRLFNEMTSNTVGMRLLIRFATASNRSNEIFCCDCLWIVAGKVKH